MLPLFNPRTRQFATRVVPIPLRHGRFQVLGFRFGNVAYSCDLNGLMPESLPLLAGLDLWILDALRYTPHPSHLSVADALKWIDRMRPKRAILTNLHCDLDYEILRSELPPHIEPAYDGMTFTVPVTD